MRKSQKPLTPALSHKGRGGILVNQKLALELTLRPLWERVAGRRIMGNDIQTVKFRDCLNYSSLIYVNRSSQNSGDSFACCEYDVFRHVIYTT